MKKIAKVFSAVSIITGVFVVSIAIFIAVCSFFIKMYFNEPHPIGRKTCYAWDDGDWQLIGRVGKEPILLDGDDAGLKVWGIDGFAKLDNGQFVFMTSPEYNATVKSETGSTNIKNGDRYIYVDMESDEFEFLSSLKQEDRELELKWVYLQ